MFHLLIEYLAKVPVPTLVNSLKGVSEQAPAPPAPGAWQAILEWRSFGRRLTLGASCGGAPISIIRQYIEGAEDL
jgi:putative transposase